MDALPFAGDPYAAYAPAPGYGAAPPNQGGGFAQPMAPQPHQGVGFGGTEAPPGYGAAMPDPNAQFGGGYGPQPGGFGGGQPQQGFGGQQGYAPPQHAGYGPAVPNHQGYGGAPPPPYPGVPHGQPAAPPPAAALAGQGALSPNSPQGQPALLAIPLPPNALRGFLLSYQTNTQGEFWPLHGGRKTVGRANSGEQVDIPLSDATISSRHAAFVVDAVSGAVVVEDTGSTNGTFVNEEHLGSNGRRELRDGDRLRFGGFSAIVKVISRI